LLIFKNLVFSMGAMALIELPTWEPTFSTNFSSGNTALQIAKTMVQ